MMSQSPHLSVDDMDCTTDTNSPRVSGSSGSTSSLDQSVPRIDLPRHTLQLSARYFYCQQQRAKYKAVHKCTKVPSSTSFKFHQQWKILKVSAQMPVVVSFDYFHGKLFTSIIANPDVSTYLNHCQQAEQCKPFVKRTSISTKSKVQLRWSEAKRKRVFARDDLFALLVHHNLPQIARPCGPFLLFVAHRNSLPLQTHEKTSKQASIVWNQMSSADKQVYFDKSSQNMSKYNENIALLKHKILLEMESEPGLTNDALSLSLVGNSNKKKKSKITNKTNKTIISKTNTNKTIISKTNTSNTNNTNKTNKNTNTTTPAPVSPNSNVIELGDSDFDCHSVY